MAGHKGRPSGRTASTKKDAGVRSQTREHSAPSGAFGAEKRQNIENVEELHPAGMGRPDQDAGGPDHHGGDPHEDRNP